MSTIATTTPASTATTSPAGKSALLDVYYTICPTFVASHIALELGWLDEEFRKAGANLKYLRAIPGDAGWLPHFSHKFDGHLFRDGGNIPSIWAHADHRPTRLLGLTAAPSGGQILVLANSGIHRVADLRGRKFGLTRSLNAAKVDFARGTAERGIEVSLALHGLTRKDVEIVDLPYADDRSHGHGVKPSEIWIRNQVKNQYLEGDDIAALREGRIDALYSHANRSAALVRTGEFKVIEDLGRHPDWTLGVANSPWAITVDQDLVDKKPGVAVAYLRAVIRAGRWANAHHEAAAALLHPFSLQPTVEDTARAIESIDLVPNLSPQNIAGITIEKDFLLSHGYVKRDFDVKQWAAPDLLAEAWRSL
ncbi:nitrate ABC transporter substrate-binding protein [Opitutaceae bacterium TAV5]|nr:nitrate ABC transporter substrate-binding protein [Opitutaceae bacterium TAV5]